MKDPKQKRMEIFSYMKKHGDRFVEKEGRLPHYEDYALMLQEENMQTVRGKPFDAISVRTCIASGKQNNEFYLFRIPLGRKTRTMKKINDQVETLAELQPNWDGEGALPVDKDILELVQPVFSSVSLTSPKLYPVPDGSIDVDLSNLSMTFRSDEAVFNHKKEGEWEEETLIYSEDKHDTELQLIQKIEVITEEEEEVITEEEEEEEEVKATCMGNVFTPQTTKPTFFILQD